MTVRIIHTKVSGKAAGTDPNRVYGTHWDADHTVTGLENVDNTSDANKPISTATQAALDAKQPLDATLTALAGVTTAADKIVYATGADTFATTDLTSTARSILDDTSTSAMRTTLGLGNVDNTSDATKNAAAVALTNKTIGASNSITVADAAFNIIDNADTTKVVKFELSGLTTSTTRTLTLPDANTTIVGTDAAQTLSNKNIGTSNIVSLLDTNLALVDNVDNTKIGTFQLSGIATGQTRTLTWPDASTTIVGTDATQTLTNKSIVATQLTGTLQAGQFPALTGDVTTSAGSLTTAIGATKVTSAMLNANVFSTAHTWAGAQTFTSTQTIKAASSASDAVIIEDSNNPGGPLLKFTNTNTTSPGAAGRTTSVIQCWALNSASTPVEYSAFDGKVGSGTAGAEYGLFSVYTIANGILDREVDFGGSNAAGLTVGPTLVSGGAPGRGYVNALGYKVNGVNILTGSTLFAVPSNPTGTTSSTAVMMGMGVTSLRITPTFSSRVFITITGTGSNNAASGALTARLYTGTGTGPANGAALTGTGLGGSLQLGGGSGNASVGFALCVSAVVTGLTPGVAVWFDVALAALGSGTASIQNIAGSAYEF